MTAIRIHDNPDKGRFELEIEGKVVFANYRLEPGLIYILHVEAPADLRGTGAAGMLMRGIVDVARTDRKKLVPICSYADFWMRRNDAEDLIA